MYLHFEYVKLLIQLAPEKMVGNTSNKLHSHNMIQYRVIEFLIWWCHTMTKYLIDVYLALSITEFKCKLIYKNMKFAQNYVQCSSQPDHSE